MYGVSLLKPRLEHADNGILCPVRGCRHHVPTQPTVLRTTPEFVCPVHKIAVSEATFAYQRETDNLLWTDAESLRLLNSSKTPDRDLRLAHDNSESALSWNVFRWLETSGVLCGLLERWTDERVVSPTMVYWSYSRIREGVHFPLYQARAAFREEDGRETEPAILVETEDLLILIDPHLGSARPSARSPIGWEEYDEAADGWASGMLKGSCEGFAGERGQFDLLRQWLLGTWMAHQEGKRFLLLYLAPGWSRGLPFQAALTGLRASSERAAMRVTWEDIHAHVAEEHEHVPGAPALLSYLEEKSAGYGDDGLLRRGFLLEARQKTFGLVR